MRRTAAAPRWGMLREGLRARARLHAAVLVAAALVVAAAVVGAVYAAAAAESIVRDTVAAASTGATGLHLVARSTPDVDTYPASDLDRVLAAAPAAGRYPGFPRRIPVLTADTAVRTSADSSPEPTRLAWREGFCAHLRILAGRCPTAAGEAIVSRRTVLDGGGFRVGGPLAADGIGRLRIVGIYRPLAEDDPFWAGFDYFDGGLRPVGGGETVLFADSVFTTRSQFVERVGSGVHAAIDYPVDPDATVIGDGRRLLGTVARVRAAVADTPFEVRTGLAGVLRTGLAQRRSVDQGTGLVALQLVLLGVAVLFFVVLDLTEGRRREIALAKLRGQSGTAVARFALTEPLVVLLAALPVGVLLGWLGGVLLGALVLRPGTPVALPPAALGSAALALGGAALAAVVSTIRVVRRPVLEQWSDAERPAGRGLRILQPVAAAAALACAVVLLLVGTASTAVLVPALLLVAVALAGVPALVALARRAAPRSRASDRIARFLVVRQLARSRTARRTAVLLATTLGLATFAVGGQTVLAGNRVARAQTELGADRVLEVASDGSADPLAAVRRADPGGTWAMAAATWLPDGGDSVGGTVLAVDAQRLAAVGQPVTGGLQDRALASLVDAGGAPTLRIVGDRLTATLTTTALVGDLPPDVLLVVRTDAGRLVRVDAGSLEAGTHEIGAAVPCSAGCTFRGFVWQRPVLADRPVGATTTLHVLAVRRDGRTAALAARTTDRRAWRAAVPVSDSSDRVSTTADGVRDVLRVEDGEGGLVYAETRLPAPAVVSPQGLVTQPSGPGLRAIDGDGDGDAIAFRVAGRTPILPMALDAGVLMDAGALDRELSGFASAAHWQVWLSPAAPADAVRRLERAGLVVGAESSVSGRAAALAREGPALAFSLLLALAVAAATLAVLATAVSAGAAARGRSRETAAMRLIGVPPATVVRAAVGEQTALLGVAALLAIPAGVVAVLLVMPLVRETATTSPVPLSFAPHPLPVLVLVVAYAAAVGLVGALTARAVVRSADPRRLREVDG